MWSQLIFIIHLNDQEVNMLNHKFLPRGFVHFMEEPQQAVGKLLKYVNIYPNSLINGMIIVDIQVKEKWIL